MKNKPRIEFRSTPGITVFKDNEGNCYMQVPIQIMDSDGDILAIGRALCPYVRSSSAEFATAVLKAQLSTFTEQEEGINARRNEKC